MILLTFVHLELKKEQMFHNCDEGSARHFLEFICRFKDFELL